MLYNTKKIPCRCVSRFDASESAVMNTVTTPYEEAIFEPIFTTPGMSDSYTAISGGMNAYTPPDSLEGSPF